MLSQLTRIGTMPNMMASMMGGSRSSLLTTAMPVRYFGYSSRYVGPNDMIRQEQDEKQKHGMKRHFYDKEDHPKMETPHKQ